MLFRTKCMNRKQKKMKIEEYVHLFFTLFILPGKRVSDLKARLDYCEEGKKLTNFKFLFSCPQKQNHSTD